MKKATASRFKRTGAAIAAATSLMVFGIGPASAHVGVTPQSTTEGGYTELTFSVPNESETAGTNKVKVELPTKTPFTSVRAKPVPGWTTDVVTRELPQPVEVQGTTVTKAPVSVVWTADGKGVLPEQYQTFSISVGTLPEAGTTVKLPTAQFYTDGTVSSWGQTGAAEESSGEVPSFITTAETAAQQQEAADAASTENASSSTGQQKTAAPTAADAEASADPAVDTTGRTLGWIGIGAGVLGLIAALAALGRTRGLHKG